MATKSAPDTGGRHVFQESSGATSKLLKKAAQRNALERITHGDAQRHLDTQHKKEHAQLLREEKEVRAQLKSLQDEQRMFNDLACFEGDFEVSSEGSPEVTCTELLPSPEVVNPYPIVFVSCSNASRPRRPLSGEFEEIDCLHASSYNTQSVRSRHHLNPGTSSQLHCSGATGGWVGAPDLHRADSLQSILSSSPSEKDKDLWPGDPQAIQSVRRPRKSVRQQRLEHRWERSKSLKERPVNRIVSTSRSLVSRSQSLRDAVRRSPNPLESNAAIKGEPQWSRNNSLKGSKQLMRSIECLSDNMAAAELSSPPKRSSGSLRMRSWSRHPDLTAAAPSTSSSGWLAIELQEATASRDCPSPTNSVRSAAAGPSPETKSSVWGFLSPPSSAKSQQSASRNLVPKQMPPLTPRRLPNATSSKNIACESVPPLPPISPGAGIRSNLLLEQRDTRERMNVREAD